jgi:hypothetical protein
MLTARVGLRSKHSVGRSFDRNRKKERFAVVDVVIRCDEGGPRSTGDMQNFSGLQPSDPEYQAYFT